MIKRPWLFRGLGPRGWGGFRGENVSQDIHDLPGRPPIGKQNWFNPSGKVPSLGGNRR